MNTIYDLLRADLSTWIELLDALEEQSYSQAIQGLNMASIGQHCRHVIEFYEMPLRHDFSLNYEARQRNLKLECDKFFAQDKLVGLRTAFEQKPADAPRQVLMALPSAQHSSEENYLTLSSSLYRELAYCLEHSIHHQALVRTALIELNLADLVSANFGYAPSTIKYQNSTCVQ